MKKSIILFVVMILSLPVTAIFAVSSGPRHIQVIGCHVDDDTCYVQISGSSVGPQSCKSISLRWHKDASNGKSILALLTAAFHDGKQVDFWIHNLCYQPQNSFPTFTFINVIE